MAVGKGVRGAATLKGWLTRTRGLDRACWCGEDGKDSHGVGAVARVGEWVLCGNGRELVAQKEWVRRGREHEG